MMKKIFILVLVSIVTVSILQSQNKGNDISGIWYMQKNKSGDVTVVEIYELAGKYYAYGFDYKEKGQNSPLKDINNPNEALRDGSLKGLIIIYDLVFDGKEWKNGYIYNPENGKTYNLQVKLKNIDTLILRASIDAAGAFGATMEWKRAEPNNTYKPLDKSQLRFPK